MNELCHTYECVMSHTHLTWHIGTCCNTRLVAFVETVTLCTATHCNTLQHTAAHCSVILGKVVAKRDACVT